MRAARVLASLRVCADSIEPSLFDIAIRTKNEPVHFFQYLSHMRKRLLKMRALTFNKPRGINIATSV